MAQAPAVGSYSKATNEVVDFAAGDNQQLTFGRVSTRFGVIVQNTIHTITYTEGRDADFFVDYENGTILRVTGGAIGAGQVHVTYNYRVEPA